MHWLIIAESDCKNLGPIFFVKCGDLSYRKANPHPCQNRTNTQLLWAHARFSYGLSKPFTMFLWASNGTFSKAWRVIGFATNVANAWTIVSFEEALTILGSAKLTQRNSEISNKVWLNPKKTKKQILEFLSKKKFVFLTFDVFDRASRMEKCP